MTYISKHRIFLTRNREAAVLEGDAKAAFLLVGVGGEVDEATAKRYDLYRFDKVEEPAVVTEPVAEEVKAETVAAATKAVASAPATKAVTEPGQVKTERSRR